MRTTVAGRAPDLQVRALAVQRREELRRRAQRKGTSASRYVLGLIERRLSLEERGLSVARDLRPPQPKRVRTAPLQIRNMPFGLRRRLERQAARKGVSMSQYVIEVIDDDLARPTMEEWLAEIRKLPDVSGIISGAEAVREARREAERRTQRWSSSTRRRL